VGTGGHITGCARVLKKAWPAFKVFAVEPAASPVISGGAPSPHPIQGIGAGFIPKNLDTSLLDGVIKVEADAAREMARRARARRACSSASRRAPRSLRSRKSCPSCLQRAACSASTTIPASAICRFFLPKDFLPVEVSEGGLERSEPRARRARRRANLSAADNSNR
jgi:hypothetical protein